jgi:phage shock protein PspC (stress-responsive transcriptional regulator)
VNAVQNVILVIVVVVVLVIFYSLMWLMLDRTGKRDRKKDDR